MKLARLSASAPATRVPLACVPGITGADIKRRVEAILVNRRGRPLTRVKQALLACATVAALAGPAIIGLVIGLGHAPGVYAQAQLPSAKSLPRFTVVSIKPSPPGERGTGRSIWRHDPTYWAAQAISAENIISYAFGVAFPNIVGAPAWAGRTHFDIQARMPSGTTEAQFRLMLQSLLADRLQLKAHQQLRLMEVAVLTAGPPGPDLHPASRNCVPPPQLSNAGFGMVKVAPPNTELAGCSVSMAAIAHFFTMAAVHPVVDETGLKGLYDVTVTIKNPPGFKGENQNEYLRRAFLATKEAFQKQLGLNLDFTKLVKRPMPVLVIDHINQPTEN